MKNIFSDEETSELSTMGIPDESEIDSILEEVEEQELEPPVTPVRKMPKAVAKATSIPNPAYKMSDNEISVIQAAMIQLDQARLYEMFLNHNLFEGVKANAAALKNVEKELKDFILERLQVLLGMKQDKKQIEAPPQKVKVELPFNDIEIDFLKALAFKGTKGESATQPSSKVIESQGVSLKPMQQQSNGGLKKLSSIQAEPIVEEIEEEDEEEVPQPKKPIVKPSANPVYSRQATPVPKTKANKTIEDIAREDLEKMKKRKLAHEMTPEELIEANKKISGNKKKSSKALPIPDADTLAMHYQMQQSKRPSSSNNFVNILSQKMGFSTNQIQNVGDDE